MRFSTVIRLYIIFTCFIGDVVLEHDSCHADSNAVRCIAPKDSYVHESARLHNRKQSQKYLLYDVNPGEGFNLRRDVYMRVAKLVHKSLEENPSDNWVLVLPPWGPLYHWKSDDIGAQEKIPWSHFFDLNSLSRYIPIMEFWEFMAGGTQELDMVYYLQHHPHLSDSKTWKETMETSKCVEEPPYKKIKHKIHGWFWGYDNIYATHLKCLSVQGTSSTLKPLLVNSEKRAIMIERAEVILHDSFGNSDYWMARRSMRFSKMLRSIGDDFRQKYLNSTDEDDQTKIHDNWLQHYATTRSAIGGPYIAVHLRRRDYLQAKPSKVPSIKHAAQQIKKKMDELQLQTVFVATDAPRSEFKELKKYIPTAIQYNPEKEVRETLKDGGIAIVDQWICAHARYFIGTYESTFSFRIHEEREIIGFPVESTFNSFCGDNETGCKQPTQWKIVYP